MSQREIVLLTSLAIVSPPLIIPAAKYVLVHLCRTIDTTVWMHYQMYYIIKYQRRDGNNCDEGHVLYTSIPAQSSGAEEQEEPFYYR